MLESFEESDIIPVIAPIGLGPKGETYNINADTVAGAIATAVGATRFLLLTDVPGVMDASGNVIPELTVSQTRQLIADGGVNGGMIPKLETCVDAVRGGVGAAVIIDGTIPHALILEIFTDAGIGTLIHAD